MYVKIISDYIKESEVHTMNIETFVVYIDFIVKLVDKILTRILKALGIDWAEEGSTGGFLSGLFK